MNVGTACWPHLVYNVVARKLVSCCVRLRRLLHRYVSYGIALYFVICLCAEVSRSRIVQLARADGALNVSIIREPEGDPPGVYQAATPVTLTCTHNGSSSATYSWTCSGESNCFTQGLTESSKSRAILRGGDTGTHTCTVASQGISGTASINIIVTGKIDFVSQRTENYFSLFIA